MALVLYWALLVLHTTETPVFVKGETKIVIFCWAKVKKICNFTGTKIIFECFILSLIVIVLNSCLYKR